MFKAIGGALLGAMICTLPLAGGGNEISSGEYRVTASEHGWRIFWRDQLIQTAAWPSVVEGPGWKRVLANEGFWKLATYERDGDRLVARAESEEVTVELAAAVTQEGVELSFRFDTALTPLEDAAFWFGALPLEEFGGCFYRADEESELVALPPVIRREREAKSRWRISGDMKALTIFTSRGNLHVESSDYFYLFDGRFHGYFIEPGRTISLTTPSKLESGRDYRFSLRMEAAAALVPELLSDREILRFQPLGTSGGLSLTNVVGGGVPSALTQVWTSYDDEALYVSFRCADARGKALADLPRTKEVYEDECVELFLNTEGGAGYKHLMLSIKNQLQVRYAGARPLYDLTPEDVTHTVKIDDSGWYAELKIPLEKLGLTPDTDLKLTGNVTRGIQQPLEYQSAAKVNNSFHEPQYFLPLIFSGRPEEANASVGGEVAFANGAASLAALVRNATDEARTVTPQVLYGTMEALRTVTQEPVAVAAGGTAGVAFDFEVTPDDQELFLQLLDAENGAVLAVSNPYFFAQLNLGNELAALPEQVATIAATLEAEELLTEFMLESEELARRYAASEASPEEAMDAVRTLRRLDAVARQGRRESLRRHMDYQVVSPLEKIKAATPLSPEAVLGGALSLQAAGDEVVNGQIVLLPMTLDLGEVRVEVSDLRKANEAVIPAEQVRVYRTIEVIPDGTLWPDRLTLDVAPLPRSANVQPWWVTVAVPPGASAGRYEGTIGFHAASGGVVEVPVRLEVLDFDLPRLEEVFAWSGYARKFFDSPEVAERFARELMERDLFPATGVSHPQYLDTTDFRFGEVGEEALERFNLALLAMYPWVEWLYEFYSDGAHPDAASYYEAISEVVRADAARLAERGQLDRAYVYYDEINSEQDEVKEMLMKLKRDAGVKIITCFCTPSLGTSKMDYYLDMVDLYFFSDGYFTDSELLAYIRGLQAKGRGVGWYFNLSYPKFPTSNCIDAPGVANRIGFFMQWKYGIDVSLFWGTNSWRDHDFSTAVTEFKNRGDGLLFYPHAESGFEPSIRSELLRDGTQDYRYLHYLATLKESLAAEGVTVSTALAAEIEGILAVDWVGSVVDYPLEPAVIEGQRLRLVAAIEALRALR